MITMYNTDGLVKNERSYVPYRVNQNAEDQISELNQKAILYKLEKY